MGSSRSWTGARIPVAIGMVEAWRQAACIMLIAALAGGCATAPGDRANSVTTVQNTAESRGAKRAPAPDYHALAVDGQAYLWLDADQAENLGISLDSASMVWPAGSCAYSLIGWNRAALTKADAPLVERLRQEGTENAYVLLTSVYDQEAVAAHLRKLRHMTLADGQLACFEFGSARELELFSSGLSEDRWHQMLGPIHRVIWPIGAHAPGRDWREAFNVRPVEATLPGDGAFHLSEQETEALDAAAGEAFLRLTAHDLRETLPALRGEPDEVLMARLRVIQQSALDLGFRLETHIQRYMELRLTYPDEAFAADQPAGAVLGRTEWAPRQRLVEAEPLLKQHAVSTP